MGPRGRPIFSSIWRTKVKEAMFRRAKHGHFSPLRYPGGKGKLATFISDIVRINNLVDGTYIEPYAGGAAVAWELLLTGLMRRVIINDASKPIYEFWNSVFNRTDDLIELIQKTPVNTKTWRECRRVFSSADASGLELGYATFFLNRTNRSGILNGGMIGGKEQKGEWKIDARFNKADLVQRILLIAMHRRQVSLFNCDAIDFINGHKRNWESKSLVYMDPPYYKKGRDLYYDFYGEDDHTEVAAVRRQLAHVNWLVSYDDVPAIRSLYKGDSKLIYTIGYSARGRSIGTEAMFFSPSLSIPECSGSMVEVDRSISQAPLATL
jgi:DNA adenine methylase